MATIRRPERSGGRGGARIGGGTDGGRTDSKKTIYLRRGVHFLRDTILMLPCDSGLAIRAYGTEQATLSGGTRLACSWKPFRDGIYVSDAPKDIRVFTQLFADGIRQVRARFPNCPDGRKGPSAGYPETLVSHDLRQGRPRKTRTLDCQGLTGKRNLNPTWPALVS